MRIAIVMTYFDRQYQLRKTLESFENSAVKDFEVIIVDDCSPDHPVIGNHNFAISVFRTQNKKWIDGSPAYNVGIREAIRNQADIIILQNAETYHVGDVISRALSVRDNTYISFACYNLSRQQTFAKHDIYQVINRSNSHALNNDDDAWLNHRLFRPMAYHWCSAITVRNMIRLNGFDERFADGYCFEDDELLARIRILGLRIEITDHPFVVHQWHERSYVPANWKELFDRNRNRFKTVQRSGNPYAIHRFTPNVNAI